MRLIKLNISAFVLIILSSCAGNSNQRSVNIISSVDAFETQEISKIKETEAVSVVLFENNFQKVKLSKAINTKQNEYYPIPNSDGSVLYFVGMDRSGQFSTKIDFTKTRSYGGEDIWYSQRVNGVYTDAKPLNKLNDNNHQAVVGFSNNKLLVYGIYEEAYRVDASGTSSGMYNGDIFQYNMKTNKLEHFGQPVNSIFFESDGFVTEDANTLLFVTDRNPLNGPYKQKGWKYNESFWGNTDIWVSERVDDYWSEPINLGDIINTEFGERTPYLSADKKKL